jgi:LAGLIDADG endonuclease
MTFIESKKNLCYDWLAGLIDGDGCFLISAKGYASLEITVATADLPMLQKLQTLYGGGLKARAGSHSVRYRLHGKPGLLKLVKDVNGRIRNSVRQDQYRRICDLYDLTFTSPGPYNWDSGYASGLFDSDGKIVLSVKAHTAPKNTKGIYGKIERLSHATEIQLSLGITQKYYKNLSFLTQPWNQEHFGFVTYDKSQNGYYTWYVTSRRDIFKMLHYFDFYPCHSVRGHRVAQIKSYYALIAAGCITSKHPNLTYAWRNFSINWFKYYL